MSKAFVIKNKEGKYLKRGFTRFENPEKDGVFNTGHFYYENKEEAESDIVCYGFEDCEVVEVTIAEGNFDAYIDKLQDERDFERRDKTLIVKQLNDPNDYVIREDYIKLEQENKQLKEKISDYEKALNCELFINFKLPMEHTKLKREVEELKEQLAEKDRDIEELEFEKRNTLGLIEKVSIKGQQEIRKQVCDEIREKLPYYEYSFQEPEVPRVNVIEIRDIEFILNQTEQAKESMK